VQPHVAEVGCTLSGQFGYPIYGFRSGDGGDHSSGLALDVIVSGAGGYEVADYVLANMGGFGVNYVIYEQQINFGAGWEPMEDRGSVTANHFDHVHISFY
jgi:hypothetical protein